MAQLTPLPRWYEVNANGAPLAGGKLWSYLPGTLTPKATKTTQAGTVDNTNPVILGADGRADIWLDGPYRLRLLDDQDNQIYDVDNVNVQDRAFAAIDSSLRTASAGVGVAEDLQVDTILPGVMGVNRVLEYRYDGESAIVATDENTGIVRINTQDVFTVGLGGGVAPTKNAYEVSGQIYMRDTTLSILYADNVTAAQRRVEITPFDASAGFDITFRVSRANAGNICTLEGSRVTIIGN